jgi:signal transduction histidine kinase
VLREDGADAAGPPEPALAQLPDLLEESRSAGMTLRARIDVPDSGSLPPSLGRTAYRVVQEGLTNARKHAPGADVEVTVAADAQAVLVAEVVSHPPAGVPASVSTLTSGSVPAGGGIPAAGGVPAPGGAGAGLIGLAERLALLGGELEHGTTPVGDFVLRATVPRRP